MMSKKQVIEKCAICGKENVEGIREMMTNHFGIGQSSGCEEFCIECFDKNSFKNSYGFTFLKYKNELFCYKPYHYLDFGFRQVLDDKEIERAFNPEYYEFTKWLHQ